MAVDVTGAIEKAEIWKARTVTSSPDISAKQGHHVSQGDSLGTYSPVMAKELE